MADKDINLDLTGVGKVAEAIPDKSWNTIVETACNTFSDLVAPITKTTGGIGRLIEAKFDRYTDVEKVFAADTIQRAWDKVEQTKRKVAKRPKSKILIAAIEAASNESDESLRDIWSNLIANEILEAQVHPEFPRILNRLAPKDAITLAQIGGKEKLPAIIAAAKSFLGSFLGSFYLGDIVTPVRFGDPTDFSHEHLERLGVIKRRDGIWSLSSLGFEFLKSVTDPTLQSERENTD